MTDELHHLTIAEASRLLAKGTVSSLDLVEASLARIAAVEPQVHSFVTVLADEARAAACAADAERRRGGARSPLHGIPIGLKDIYDTADIPTTGHSRVAQNRVPTRDSACWERLRAAGAILIGKLATHEFATGGPSFDLPWPPARNPWRLNRFPGGSSSGSGAAVAAGQVLGAMGTDTGGSIRLPAAFCGLVGIKPTFGRVSRRGVLPLSWTFDNCGPMTWTVEDCALMLQAVAGHDPEDRYSADVPVPDYTRGLDDGIRGLRIGLVRHFYETDRPADPQVVAAMDAAVAVLRDLGAEVREVTLPSLATYQACFRIIALCEAFAIHAETLRHQPDLYGEVFRYRMMPGGLVAGADYVAAQRQLRRLIARSMAVFEDVDAVVTATTFGGAPVITGMRPVSNFADPPLTPPFNVTQWPAIALCNGFTADGLPLSMQVACRPFDEATVLRIAQAYEKATDWRAVRPPFVADPDPAPSTADYAADGDGAAYAPLMRSAGLPLEPQRVRGIGEAMPHVEAMAARLPHDLPWDAEPMSITTLLQEG